MLRKIRLMTTVAALLLAITGSITFGWNLVTNVGTFSILGVFLVGRKVFQLIRARIHLHQMRQIYLPLLEAIHRLYPAEFPEHKIKEWQYKRLNPEHWMKALKKEVPKIKSRRRWKQVINEALNGVPMEKWRKAFPGEELVGTPAEFARSLAVAGVPVYGITDAAEMRSTLQAIAAQTVGFKKVAVVLNEPSNVKMRRFIRGWINLQPRPDKWLFIDLPISNKKEAMAAAVTSLTAPLFVNIDSDTKADQDALFFSIMAFVTFPFLHGITSNVRIRNLGNKLWGNLLKFLTYYRYDSVNNMERAGRRFNETVLSGPWLVVRQASFLSFLPEWLNFQFRGMPVRPGDDRLITFFLNWRGWATAYIPQIVVYTDCPETWGRWRAQQRRWTQSYYIYMIKGIELGQAWHLKLWSLLDLVYGGFFSYFLLGAVASVIFRIMPEVQAGSPIAIDILKYYLVSIFFANFANGAYSAIANRSLKGFIAMFYVIPFVVFLMPIKLTKPFTLTEQRWLGRNNVR